MQIEDTKIDEKVEEEPTQVERIKQVLRNKSYLLMCGSLTFIYYIITGVQFWLPDYMINELNANEKSVLIAFNIVSSTGPVLGIFFGGYAATLFGGYATKQSVFMSMILMALTITVTIPVAFINSFIGVNALLWLIFFFTGSALPCMTGIMLNSVSEKQLNAANSLANFSYNILGYLAGTFVYGLIYDAGGNGIGKAAILSLMFIPILSILFMFLAAYFIFKENVLGFEIQEKEQE